MSATLRAAHCRSGERRPWIPSLSGEGLTQALEVYLSRLQIKHPTSSTSRYKNKRNGRYNRLMEIAIRAATRSLSSRR